MADDQIPGYPEHPGKEDARKDPSSLIWSFHLKYQDHFFEFIL